MKTKNEMIRWVLVAIMILLAAIYKSPEDALYIGISIAIIVVLVTYRRKKDPEKDIVDERMKKLGSTAAAYSWTATFVMVSIFYWFYYLKIVEMPGEVAVALIFAFMAATLMIFRFYLNRKGV
jgi:apolipoprotein N-acyltransferase